MNMPNWCYTKITINHEDERKLKELENKIDEFTSHDYMENGFGLKWLGNIVGNSGIGTVDENPETDLRCRGSITYIENYGDQLVIDTETAWTPMLEMWVKLLEKYLPDAELIYSAEECGCGIWSTNDPCMKGCYVIDALDMENVESDWEAPEGAVVKLLQELLQTENENIDELLEAFEESDFSYCLGIHKWNYDEVDIWD